MVVVLGGERKEEDEDLTWALDQREHEGGESLDVVLALCWLLWVFLGREGSKEIRKKVGPTKLKILPLVLLQSRENQRDFCWGCQFLWLCRIKFGTTFI